MDLRWLEDVLVLLEEKNLTRAAARQNITQPAFSRRIRSFEDWLGTPVLNRGTNRVGLSDALMSSEAEIRALTERVQQLRGRIASFDPASSTVTIAAQHAPIHSTFPDMAVLAKRRFPALNFRLRAGNQRDCVSMFLRGDTDILLCYEAEGEAPMPFGDTIKRAIWGTDFLVPVVGGDLRYRVGEDGAVASDLPAIVYPEGSYFGNILGAQGKAFGTRLTASNVVCETAFSNGIKELVLKGMGVSWLPVSMAYRDIEQGELISLASQFGRIALQYALYAQLGNDTCVALLDAWTAQGRAGPLS